MQLLRKDNKNVIFSIKEHQRNIRQQEYTKRRQVSLKLRGFQWGLVIGVVLLSGLSLADHQKYVLQLATTPFAAAPATTVPVAQTAVPQAQFAANTAAQQQIIAEAQSNMNNIQQDCANKMAQLQQEQAGREATIQRLQQQIAASQNDATAQPDINYWSGQLGTYLYERPYMQYRIQQQQALCQQGMAWAQSQAQQQLAQLGSSQPAFTPQPVAPASLAPNTPDFNPPQVSPSLAPRSTFNPTQTFAPTATGGFAPTSAIAYDPNQPFNPLAYPSPTVITPTAGAAVAGYPAYQASFMPQPSSYINQPVYQQPSYVPQPTSQVPSNYCPLGQTNGYNCNPNYNYNNYNTNSNTQALATCRQCVNAWIQRNNLNQYGDTQGTMYTGGTPLFNEATGQRIDVYQYIATRHPDHPWRSVCPHDNDNDLRQR